MNELWHIKSLLFHEINLKGKIRDEKAVAKLQQLVNRVDQISVDDASINAQYLYHHIKSAYYFSVNDLTCSNYHLAQNCELIETNDSFLSDRPNIYFSILTNLIYVTTRLKKYEDAQAALSKLKSLANKGENQKTLDLDIKYFSSTFSLELYLLCEQGEFRKAEKLVPTIQDGYEKFGEHINPLRRAYLDFKIAVTYLSLGEYSTALQWVNRILNDSKIDQNQDIYCFTQLINLILHVELNNTTYLPYALLSVKRYFKTRNRIYKFEELFLKLINQLSKSENIFDLTEKLIPFEKELAAIKNDAKEQVIFEYFDFHTWVKSKLERKSFIELRNQAVRISA